MIQSVETEPLASTLTDTTVGPRWAWALQAPPDWRLTARTPVYPSASIAALAAASFAILPASVAPLTSAPLTSAELRASSSGSSQLGGPSRKSGTGFRDVFTIIVVASAGDRTAVETELFAGVAGRGKDERFSRVGVPGWSGIGSKLCALPMPIPIAVARTKAGNQRFIA